MKGYKTGVYMNEDGELLYFSIELRRSNIGLKSF
jgi:hypothetical protein